MGANIRLLDITSILFLRIVEISFPDLMVWLVYQGFPMIPDCHVFTCQVEKAVCYQMDVRTEVVLISCLRWQNNRADNT